MTEEDRQSMEREGDGDLSEFMRERTLGGGKVLARQSQILSKLGNLDIEDAYNHINWNFLVCVGWIQICRAFAELDPVLYFNC
jgi:hypothetical protein